MTALRHILPCFLFLMASAKHERHPLYFRVFTPETVKCAPEGLMLEVGYGPAKSTRTTGTTGKEYRQYTYNKMNAKHHNLHLASPAESPINITSCYTQHKDLLENGLNQKVILFAHGFTDHSAEDEFQDAGRRMAEAGYTALMLDWSTYVKKSVSMWNLDGTKATAAAIMCRMEKGGTLYKYTSAYRTSASTGIGNCAPEVVEFVKYLRSHHKLGYVHLVGFSLGTQLVGRVGYLLKQEGRPVDRITALDPANPGFYDGDRKHPNYLDKTDANFVDVIHSNAGCLGAIQAIGHVDYYIDVPAGQPIRHQIPRRCRHKTCGPVGIALGYVIENFPDAPLASHISKFRKCSNNAASSCAHHMAVAVFLASFKKCAVDSLGVRNVGESQRSELWKSIGISAVAYEAELQETPKSVFTMLDYQDDSNYTDCTISGSYENSPELTV